MTQHSRWPESRYYLIALAVILLDQVVKLIVKLNMRIGEDIPILGDFFRIYFIENRGAAFGVTLDYLWEGLSAETAKVILTLFSVGAVFFIIYFLRQVARHPSRLPFFLAFILGGAVGNIIDRVFYGIWFAEINDYEGGLLHGRVVDMFYIDIYQGFLPEWIPLLGGMKVFLWPIFNIADAAISIGIVAILIFQNSFFRDIRSQDSPEAGASSQSTRTPTGSPFQEVSPESPTSTLEDQ